uniref:Uncharacterized protein n=1 Tax=Setaria italica TaxID=4555 RepID=K3ZY71_SETIT
MATLRDGRYACRVIQLQSLLPIRNTYISHEVIGFAEGTDTIFLKADVAIFTLEIESGKTKKVGKGGSNHAILPYMSFCAPGLFAISLRTQGSIHEQPSDFGICRSRCFKRFFYCAV